MQPVRIRKPLTRMLLIRVIPGLPVLLLAGACEINSPQLPSFETTVTMPLGLERFEIAEIVEDDDTLVIGPAGGVVFRASGSPDTLAFDHDLAADFPAQAVRQDIGSFQLDDPEPVASDYPLAEAWPPAAGLVGVQTEVPPFGFDLTSDPLDLGGIEECHLAAGDVALTITNGWPVPLGDGAEPVELLLEDPADGSLILGVTIDQVAPGATVTALATLAGRTVPGSVRVRIQGVCPGSSGNPVLLEGDEFLGIMAAFTGLEAQGAVAEIPAQEFLTTFATALPIDHELVQGVVAAGDLLIDLASTLPVPVEVTITWDQVRTPDGAPLTTGADVAAGEAVRLAIPFAGCTIGDGTAAVDSLRARIVSRTPGSEGQAVSLTSTQGLTADLNPGVLLLASLTGCLASDTVAIDPLHEIMEYPEDSEGILFTSARLVIDVDNAAEIGADLDLVIMGSPRDTQPVFLEVRQRLEPARDGLVKTRIILDGLNSGLVDFLNTRPVVLTLAGAIETGGSGSCGTVKAGDHAVVGWELEVPLEIVLGGTVITGDAKPLDLDEDLQDSISTHAGGAVFSAEVTNHLPFALELTLLAGQDPGTIESAPDLVIGPILIAAPPVDPLTGLVLQSGISRPRIVLDTAAARLFGRPGLHTRIQVSLPAGDGETVRVMGTDYLEVRGVVELDVRIDEDL